MTNYDDIVAQTYREMELSLVESMKRNLTKHIAEEVKTGVDYPQWQALKLKSMQKYIRQNKRIIRSYTSGMSGDVAEQLHSELKQGKLSALEQFKEALGAGYKSSVAVNDSFFKINTRKVDALIGATTNDLTKANAAALRMIDDTYRSTIFKYGMYLSNGVYTPTQAYDAAVNDFLSRGINCIEYRNGRRVNIADYAEMAVRTVSKRAQLMGEGQLRKQIGNPLILIYKHNTSCKLCLPFQGKVLIDDVYSGGTKDDGDYMLLSEAMKLGLYHPRCKHGCGTYYPELEEINHYDTPENPLNKYNDTEINQAHIDNMIQKYKRLSLGSVDPDNVAKYQEQLKIWEDKKADNLLQKQDNSDIIINENNEVVQGKNIVGEWQPSGNYEHLIEDVMHAQGYDGVPKVLPHEKFKKCMQDKGFYAERTYCAPDEATLKQWRKELYSEKWYVDCSTGGSQYGQGMYCAGCYDLSNSQSISGLKSEMSHYQMIGASTKKPYHYTEGITLDKNMNILTLPHGAKAEEYTSDCYTQAYMRKYASPAQSGLVEDYISTCEKISKLTYKEEESFIDGLYNTRNSLADQMRPLLRKGLDAQHYTTATGHIAIKDPGVLASEMGYDAINAVGHGATGSYTVILNRTKVIFCEGGSIYGN